MSQQSLLNQVQSAKSASITLAQLSSADKNQILTDIAGEIVAQTDAILVANAKDIESGKEKGLSSAMLDRLLLTPERIQDIAAAITEIVQLPDPVGDISGLTLRPNGIQVGKMRIPLGVIAMIYEARPNVTAEAAALCIKSGNAVVLRGGSEAIASNLALADCLQSVLAKTSVNPAAVTVVANTDRAVIEELLTFSQYIDLVIPRGGEGLIRYVTQHSQIPVIQHFKGVCHLYIDEDACVDKAINILMNGKTQRPSACNAFETVLIHQAMADKILPRMAKELASKQVKIHACEQSLAFFDHATLATCDDYEAEYLAQEIAIRVVDDFDQAVAHIYQYSSDHTEVIVTQNYSRAQQFVRAINSSVVMVNASSRFSDGGQLGLGAEIGISTSKLHAYGPMGLSALTTEKFIVFGDGQVRT